eukprot:CAMPEP_0202728948 /NCGR_PEP_ID=MMETSP1385-20130828/185884_1 /ASSEMBLY_ACC=CAM_ASM_000861 /TAXON_ID=933848 /ORGANISM="Elphidium margaritaceum" /LENGTH=589 /DNA_ID=CAMNT_0049395201 /DNA_START=31 /DNA_END=1800 /DNA_ORIENTATION=-
MSDLLRVKFTASNAVRSKRPYTIYEIEVRSTSTMPWLLYKRYRDFDNLHEQLVKLMSSNADLERLDIKLHLPPKRLVRSMAPDVVAKRQKELEGYLQHILSFPLLMRNQLVMDFLSVPESLRAMLMRRKPTEDASTNGLPRQRSDSFGFSSQTEEEREVNQLLKELSLQKNRVKALNKFEKWYFEKCTKKDPPNMRPDLIKKLYTGDETHQGLVHSCRLLHSKVAWRASIALLVRLLDIERNRYARIFQEVFLTLQQGLYKEMYLHQHINETSQEDGFKIVHLIENNLPALDHKFYVPDEAAWKHYEKWEKLQRDSFGVAGGTKRRNEFFEDDLNEQQMEYAYNWDEMQYAEIAENIFSLYRELSAESDADYQKVNTVKNDCGLKVRYKKDPFTKQWKLKITFAVDHPPESVYNFLSTQMINVHWTADQSDMSWNTKIIQQQQVEKLDAMHFIIHQTYKSFNSMYKFSDFLLLTCLRKDVQAKRFHILFASVNNYRVSLHSSQQQQSKMQQILKNNNSNTKRAILLPSGFEIRPTKENVNKSHVSFRAHMTNESVLTVSADLLGETDELFKSMLRIQQLISVEMNYSKK